MANTDTDVGIVGAGISGLTTAYSLMKNGISSTVYEKDAEVGGVIRTVREGPWQVELGPNTILAKKEAIWELFNELDMKDSLVEANKDASRRYIVKDGSPVSLPTSLGEFLNTNLISGKAKLRLLKEPFIPAKESPESIAQFIRRRLGEEVLDYAVNPFVAGVYAGDPENLSISHTFSQMHRLEQQHGSLFWGGLKNTFKKSGTNRPGRKLISFDLGLQQLPLKISEKMGGGVKLNSTVSSISGSGEGWELTLANDHKPARHRAVISSAPLHCLPGLELNFMDRNEVENLAAIRYAPVAVVALGYRKSTIAHPLDGFGMLVPGSEPFNILGALFSSSLFENRAPAGHALLTCFVGGERHPEQVGLNDSDLTAVVQDDLEKLLGISGRPEYTMIKRWEQAIPQYGMKYEEKLDIMREAEKHNPGFFLDGSFREDVSVPGCITRAIETAARVSSFLES